MLKTDPPKWYWTEMILQIKHGLLRNTNYMHLVTYWQHLRVQPVDNHCVLWIIQEYFAILFFLQIFHTRKIPPKIPITR